MNASLTRRLLVGLTIVVGASSVLVLASLDAYETRVSRAALDRDVDGATHAFAGMMEPVLWDVDMDRAARVADAFARDPRIARVSVREASSNQLETIERIATRDTALRVLPVLHGADTVGQVSVAFDRGYYHRQVAALARTALLVTLAALGVTLLGLGVIFRRLLRRPLEELSAAVATYASDEPRPATVIPYIEFRELERVLRAMSTQIRTHIAALANANRELEALNRFLRAASNDADPDELVKEACCELRGLLGATRVAAELVDDFGVTRKVCTSPAGEVSGPAAAASIEVPIVVNSRRVGAIYIGRDQRREFESSEISLANAIAAQVAAGISRFRAHGAERLLRTAIEQLPDSVIITDRERRIVYVNPAFTAISGYTREEAIGRNPRDLKRASDADESDAAMLRELAAGRAYVGRLTSRTKTGERYFEQIAITGVRNERGDITHRVSIGRDITVEMQRDEQLRHAQRMEAVGQLAGGLAHDFNNMLAAVLMQLDLLDLDGSLSAEVHGAVQDMRDAVDRAGNLTRQLLMFSRRQAMCVEPHDLNATVQGVLKMLRRVIGERIRVSQHVSPQPVAFEGDEGMIEQVIVNLCVNARDAMPTGGQLSVGTSIVTMGDDADHPGRWACLEVRDTGIGMSAETMNHIFEPFFTTKPVGKGTGLGLATTHGIVTQHGGWITVDSTVGAGTTFRVFLPGLLEVPKFAARPTVRALARGNTSIMVVEDEALVRQMVSRSLRRLGHRVVEATSGRDAMRIWSNEGDSVDLVLTDMVMPDGVNGVELVQNLRRTRPDLRAIIMSGYSNELKPESIPRYATFLPKPFSLAALNKALESAIGA